MVGLGELPATQLLLTAAAPGWTYVRESVSFTAERRLPPNVTIHYAGGPCAPGAPFGCEGARADDPSLKAWAGAVVAGTYDARALALARNWIFARHGRPFKEPWLDAYFRKQSWYRPDAKYSDARLSPDDRAAIEALTRLAAGK